LTVRRVIGEKEKFTLHACGEKVENIAVITVFRPRHLFFETLKKFDGGRFSP
jgi:hypothetical protein